MARTKDLILKEKIVKLPISKFIDTKFRDYAIYVVESRGIPNFYDALTPVQRYILKSTPTSFAKTLTVVGKCIQQGYHHGDTSITKSLNKLARPFGNGMQIIEGYGFFGSEVSPDPAAARYTSVKLSNKAADILNKYEHLTTREVEGAYYPLWMDVPLGLTVPIVGIAVGYKSTILPRKLDHIKEFLEGTRKSLKPFFVGFTGNVQKYNGIDNSWILSSDITYEERKIKIKDIPPFLKYKAALRKLDNIISKYEGFVRIVDNSNTKVDITILYIGNQKEQWDDIKEYVQKAFSIIVKESVVFVKDNKVLTYDSIEQYLEDYKWQVLRLKEKHLLWERDKLSDDLAFNKAKKIFIEYILEKRRSDEDITEFLKDYNRFLRSRLEGLTSRKFTSNELEKTKNTIKELTDTLMKKEKEYLIAKKEYDKTPDPTIERGIGSRKNSIDLFETDDIDESREGIVIWNGEDVYEKEQEEVELEG